MDRIKKHIPSIFSFLVSLMLYAHMTIPHDHHNADSVSCNEKRAPSSDKSKSHHRGFPIHCQAFNDLASEKPLSFVNIVKYIQCNNLLTVSVSDSEICSMRLLHLRINDLSKQALSSVILDLSTLRAPPSFC